VNNTNLHTVLHPFQVIVEKINVKNFSVYNTV